MECRNVREMLSAYVDAVLTDEERMRVEDHIRSCSRCSAALAEIRNTVMAAKKLPEVEPPPGLSQKIMDSIKAETGKKGFIRTLFCPLHIKVPLEAFAVIAVAVTAFYIYQSTGQDLQRIRPEAKRDLPASQPSGIAGKGSMMQEHPQSPAEEALPPTPMKSLDMREQRDAGVRALQKREMARPEGETRVMSVYVKDLDIAAFRMGEIVRDLHGEISSRASLWEKSIIELSIDAGSLNQFMNSLEEVGRVDGPRLESRAQAASILIRVELLQAP